MAILCFDCQFGLSPIIENFKILTSRKPNLVPLSALIDIRLDLPALRRRRVREREPVTLNLSQRKLETVLQAIVLDLNLTWILMGDPE